MKIKLLAVLLEVDAYHILFSTWIVSRKLIIKIYKVV